MEHGLVAWEEFPIPASGTQPNVGRIMFGSSSQMLGLAATGYSGVFAALTALLQTRQMLRRRAACDISARFFAAYSGGYAIWLLYGLSVGDVPLIVVDVAGLLCGSVTLAVALSSRLALPPRDLVELWRRPNRARAQRNECDDRHGFYDEKRAASQLRNYRKKGPIPSTRALIEALRADGVEGATLLDIGGGIGAIQHELLEAGVTHVTAVDASAPYLNAAREEGQRREHGDRATYLHGDFVHLADSVPPVEIVTLDRVINVYPDWERLLGLAAALAGRLLGLVYPRDTHMVRFIVLAMNLVHLRRKPVRAFIRSSDAIERVAREHGRAGHSSRRRAGLARRHLPTCPRGISAVGSRRSCGSAAKMILNDDGRGSALLGLSVPASGFSGVTSAATTFAPASAARIATLRPRLRHPGRAGLRRGGLPRSAPICARQSLDRAEFAAESLPHDLPHAHDLPAGTVTFLFTDVEGSARLLRDLGAERYADALAEHRRVIREACSAEGGVEVDTQGDAFFFAFPTAAGALSAAGAFTDALTTGPSSTRRPAYRDAAHDRRGLRRSRRPLRGASGCVGTRRAGDPLRLDRRARRVRAHRPRRAPAQGHRAGGLAPPVGPGAVPPTQDDLEHEPAPPGELLRRP